MALTELEPVAPTAPREERAPDYYEPMQKVTRQIAFGLGGGGWDDERRQKIAEFFVNLAPEWHTRSGEERLNPTRDAIDRSGPLGGIALEVGSGTGIQTPVLTERFDYVVSVDLVAEMLDLSPRPDDVALVRADASRLPFADQSIDAIICVNAFIFPSEYARVLSPRGRVVFVSSSGELTPIYMPPPDVVAALEPALGPIEAVTSRFGWSVWTAVTRAP